MSPEPDAEQLACNKFVAIEKETDVAMEENLNNLGLPTDSGEICQQTDEALPRKQRERRNKSPIAISTLMESFAAPLSPASSSCTSQGNSSADATFEPSIDMMVNDFDDEQTLNEEEALAAMEHQDPHDEIATLQEESEMPLEELLAKYQVAPQVPVYVSSSRKKKRTAGSGKNSKHRKVDSESTVGSNSAEAGTETALESIVDNEAINSTDRSANDVILIEESGDEEAAAKKSLTDMGDNDESLTPEEFQSTNEENNDTLALNGHTEKSKQRRTHLMDLYPEESFTAVINSVGDQDKDISLELLYNEEIEEDIIDAEEEEEDEFDSDYVKKTIMVGSSYQATIPDGLSQYGDVLPYENEDKLIWEPSQVSEKEVEEYLLKARDIKPSLLDNVDEECEEPNQITPSGNADSDATNTVINGIEAENAKSFTNQKTEDTQSTMTSLAGENVDVTAVIKDNEQALHLLVQCGYDFKEALRRKRLNALPLTGSMSLWSEEECHKFEEGIQKFGKDFLKIRQNQVRTRTMRELVQFYYLWKKSDRRDHNFANSDTVDHMDIYLNEGGDYSPTGGINGNAAAANSSNNNGAATLGTRKNSVQKNPISIMMTGSTSSNTSNVTTTVPATQLNTQNNKVVNNRKRSVIGSPNSNYENTVNPSLPVAAVPTK